MPASVIYQQAVVVLNSSSGLPDTQGSAISSQPVNNWQIPRDLPVYTQRVIINRTFSSVPVVWESELARDYQELGAALSEMTRFDEDSEQGIDPSVYSAASHVATNLMSGSFPAPRVFTHGPKSVVFNWSNQDDNLYLTISADHISALISSPERIKRRIEYSANELADPILALSSIRAEFTRKPVTRLITGSISTDMSELVG